MAKYLTLSEARIVLALSKLNTGDFIALSRYITNCANEGENETDGATLVLITKLIYEKATDDAAQADTYARLCRKLMEEISPKVADSVVKNSAGRPITGGQLFQKYLLNRCQQDWELQDARRPKIEIAPFSDAYFAAEKVRRQRIGLARFIGELYKQEVLPERNMHECIKQLLANVLTPVGEDIESLCCLLVTVGPVIDTGRTRPHVDVYFTRMATILEHAALAPLIRRMLQDVIELRGCHWQLGDADVAHSATVLGDASVARDVKAILNKLTVEKFDKLSDQVIDWANKSENETDGATLILVIKLIFEKATDEAAWSEMYARLCRKMMEKISPKVEVKSVKNSAGQPIQGGQLFRKYLLNRCQEDFQNGWATRTKTAAAAADKAQDDEAKTAANEGKGEGEGETVLCSDEYYAAEKAKRRGLGLVKFIGELFKLQMLTERIMHECIKQLLANIENPEEEDIESLCRLLITVGQTMDTERARDHMNVYFTRMTEILKNPAITSRVKFMIQDVIELRNRKWQARSAIATPSTIAQVHAQAERDAAYPRNQGPAMSRGGSRRGGTREETTRGGWNVAGPSVTRVPTNLSNFGKLSKAAIQSTPSELFGVYAKKGGKTCDAPPTLSRAQSNANMFYTLNSKAPADLPPTTRFSRAPSHKASLDLGAGGVSDADGGRKKLVLAPRTVAADTAEETGSEQPEAEEAEALATDWSVMSAERAQKKIKEDIEEFWNVRNLDDAQHYFSALPTEHRHLLVAQFASSALDKREDDVKLVAEVFSEAAGGLCSEDAFEVGLLTVVEIVDDLSVDVPKAYAFVARLLHGSKLPKAKVGELSTKIIFDGSPLTPPSAKLLKEYEELQ